MTLGERIAQLRKNKNMTQEDLAEELSVSRQTISSWENDGSLPSTDQFVKLAKCFDVSLDYLILNKEEEKNNKDENKEMKFHILNIKYGYILHYRFYAFVEYHHFLCNLSGMDRVTGLCYFCWNIYFWIFPQFLSF